MSSDRLADHDPKDPDDLLDIAEWIVEETAAADYRDSDDNGRCERCVDGPDIGDGITDIADETARRLSVMDVTDDYPEWVRPHIHGRYFDAYLDAAVAPPDCDLCGEQAPEAPEAGL